MLDPLKEPIRKWLPRRICTFNGVRVRTYKWRNGRDRPDFEDLIASELRDKIEPDDRVVMVGGGHGVCSTIAATEGANVITFEPGAVWANIARETTELNDVADRVDVVHAAVGPLHDAWSAPGSAERLEASDIPECDWLVLDCEGAEDRILEGLEIRPSRLSVETHPPVTSTDGIARVMKALGYEIYRRHDDGVGILHGRLIQQ